MFSMEARSERFFPQDALRLLSYDMHTRLRATARTWYDTHMPMLRAMTRAVTIGGGAVTIGRVTIGPVGRMATIGAVGGEAAIGRIGRARTAAGRSRTARRMDGGGRGGRQWRRREEVDVHLQGHWKASRSLC